MPTIPRWLWDLWLLFLLIGAAWFGVMEGIALANKVRGDTFSEVVWMNHLPAVVLFLGAGVIIFGTIWTLIHFVSGGKWGI